jgi:hypothetical protein
MTTNFVGHLPFSFNPIRSNSPTIIFLFKKEEGQLRPSSPTDINTQVLLFKLQSGVKQLVFERHFISLMQLKALEIFATSTLSSLKSNELSSSPVVYMNINLMGYGITDNSLAVALVIDCTLISFLCL